jgi:hypothetical protein
MVERTLHSIMGFLGVAESSSAMPLAQQPQKARAPKRTLDTQQHAKSSGDDMAEAAVASQKATNSQSSSSSGNASEDSSSAKRSKLTASPQLFAALSEVSRSLLDTKMAAELASCKMRTT